MRKRRGQEISHESEHSPTAGLIFLVVLILLEPDECLFVQRLGQETSCGARRRLWVDAGTTTAEARLYLPLRWLCGGQ